MTNTGNTSANHDSALQRGEKKPEVGFDHVIETERKRRIFLESQPVLRRLHLWMYNVAIRWGFKLGDWQGRRLGMQVNCVGVECAGSGDKDCGKSAVGSYCSAKGPVVAVIIPALVVNGRDVMKLRKTLLCISQQTRKPDYAFLIDDGSPTPISNRLSLADQKGVVILRLDNNSGPAAARNEGLKASRDAYADFVCFTDSDCLPQPSWIESFLRCFQNNPDVGILSGATRGNCALETGFGILHAHFGPWNGHLLPDGSLLFGPTCNMAVRLEVVPFNFCTCFREAAFEDVEFCFRARKEGLVLLKSLDSKVIHDCDRSVFGVFGQLHRYGRNHHIMDALHPDFADIYKLSVGYCL